MVDFPHKVVIPLRPEFLVTRPLQRNLLQQITQRRLIAIVGPAGFGKTSILVDFANASELPLCWYALDGSDADVWEFLSYLAAAIDHQFPGTMASTRALLEAYAGVSVGVATSTLVREIYAIEQDFVLVLDDWHLVDHVQEIGDIVSTILTRCPHCHLLLASRIYPTVHNLMLLTARREMLSLNEQSLRFTAPEVIDVLSAHFASSIPLEQAEVLMTRADGWITGILLSFQIGDMSSLGSADLTSHRQVFRYLAEQVLELQSPDVAQFLLDSSLLAELSAEMCDLALQRHDSRRMLDILLRRHLFVSELKPGLLRYHSLFREFLQEYYSTVAPQQYRQTLRRIADVYASMGQWLQAFDHYIAASDREAARQIVASGGQQLYNAGRLATLSLWFSKLPNDELDITLLCLKARVELDLGDHHHAHATIQLAELRAQAHEQAAVLLLKAHIARNAGDYEQALGIVQGVLDQVKNPVQRATALRIMGICLHRLGKTSCAIEQLNAALDLYIQQRAQFEVAQLQRDLGLCYASLGQLRTAENYYTQADSYWASLGNAAYRAMSLNSKGQVQYRSGQYVEAHATLMHALQQAKESLVPSYEATIQSCLGDLYSELHLWERASKAYAYAWSIGSNAHVMSDLSLAQVHMFVRQQQYEQAARALRQLPEQTRIYYKFEVWRLEGMIACYTGLQSHAEQALHELFALLEGKQAPIDQARAYVLAAQIAATFQPSEPCFMLEALDQAVAIAQNIGHSAFLIAETRHLRGVLRRAAAVGWPHAEAWQQRHQDMQAVAQLLDNDDQRPLLVIHTLGVDQVWLNGTPLDIGWLKAREVLYYLLAHPEGAASEVLREAIWPHLPAERCRDTLRSAVYQLRSALPRDMIVLHGRQTYQINRDVARIEYDVEQFLTRVESHNDSEMLLEAADLYHGGYLAAIDSEWCAPLRSQLEQRYLHTLAMAAHLFERQRLSADAIAMYQRMMHIDPYNEAAYAGLMRSLVQQGNRAAAIQHYHELRRLMDEEFGLEIGKGSEIELIYRELLAAS